MYIEQLYIFFGGGAGVDNHAVVKWLTNKASTKYGKFEALNPGNRKDIFSNNILANLLHHCVYQFLQLRNSVSIHIFIETQFTNVIGRMSLINSSQFEMKALSLCSCFAPFGAAITWVYWDPVTNLLPLELQTQLYDNGIKYDNKWR